MPYAQIDESEILAYYRGRTKRRRPQLPRPLDNLTLTTSALGLGDTVILGDLPRAGQIHGRNIGVFSTSHHFKTVMSFNPFYTAQLTPFCAVADVLYHAFDLGNGHLIQRLRRAYGLPIDLRPRGCIEVSERSIRNRVIVHFEAGAHAEWQKLHVHTTARRLSAQSKIEIERFIALTPGYEFVEIGESSSGIAGTVDRTKLDLAETIELMASAQYFIGIMSGPMHIAAALDLKLVCVTNFPSPELICLPTLKDINQIESEWFYPQSVILHQEGEGKFVKSVTLDNLKRAFDGALYPYWSNRYLCLIEEEV